MVYRRQVDPIDLADLVHLREGLTITNYYCPSIDLDDPRKGEFATRASECATSLTRVPSPATPELCVGVFGPINLSSPGFSFLPRLTGLDPEVPDVFSTKSRMLDSNILRVGKLTSAGERIEHIQGIQVLGL